MTKEKAKDAGLIGLGILAAVELGGLFWQRKKINKLKNMVNQLHTINLTLDERNRKLKEEMRNYGFFSQERKERKRLISENNNKIKDNSHKIAEYESQLSKIEK